MTLTKSPRKTAVARSPKLSVTRTKRVPATKSNINFDDGSDSLLKVEGTITSMVRILEHFTVRDNQNNRFVRLTWTPKTRFVRGGKSAKSTALRIGQPVHVSCDLADKSLLAEVVSIGSAR